MLLILRHIHPALANVAGGIVGAGFVALRRHDRPFRIRRQRRRVRPAVGRPHQPRLPGRPSAGPFVTDRSESGHGSIVDASRTRQRFGSI